MQDKKTDNSESQNSNIQNPNSGILYIVSTPIGNLEDITLRALRILKSVDLIAAEGVRHSRVLCRRYGIKTRILSYNQHNQRARGPELIKRLKSGSDIALVTNAGTPTISDPGSLLINQVMAENIRVSPIPGASAVIAALSASGLQAERFLFLGYLPNRSGKRKKGLKELISEHYTMVFFEAPHRIRAMLMDLKEILGDRQIVVLREMTKAYEEVKRGSVSGVLEQLEPDKMRGEFTLVVAGKEKGEDEHLLDREIQRKIETLLKQKNMGVKEIATELSEEKGLTYRRLYKECLSIKRAINAKVSLPQKKFQ